MFAPPCDMPRGYTMTNSSGRLVLPGQTHLPGAAAVSYVPRIPPQPRSSPPPPPAAAASKIPFRPRKIRKLTSQPLDPPKPRPPPPPPSPPVIAPQIPKPLSSDGEIELALRHLRRSDPLLSALIDTLQPPAFASSARPFLALARSILYQQLATKAAQTIHARFLALFVVGGGGGGEGGGEGDDGVSPDSLLALTPQQLRQAGVSGRKAGYLRDLAEHYRSGALSDASILEMEDEALLSALTRVKGIGVWSVHMFMMFSLHRPDVLPVGDLGVRKGLQAMHELNELPKPLEMEELCEKWRPYRSVGSWYMWRLMESKAAAAKAMPASTSASVESRCFSLKVSDTFVPNGIGIGSCALHCQPTPEIFGGRSRSRLGLLALLEQLRDGFLHTVYGTPADTTSEVVCRRGHNGSKADAWSCGAILFVLLAGFMPFDRPQPCLDLGSPVAVVCWAALENKFGNLRRARELFDAATVADERHIAAWHGWAVWELKQGNVEKGRHSLAQESSPGKPNRFAWHVWGLLEASMGNIEMARKLLKIGFGGGWSGKEERSPLPGSYTGEHRQLIRRQKVLLDVSRLGEFRSRGLVTYPQPGDYLDPL
ncbi:hypothetical protein NL676_023124 [Syzygium grande]|nr:hypothetical protein NL676_023124 [Syzygium grande]